MQYVKIKDAIIGQIKSGMLSPHQKLPSERKLAESFNTTRVTLREALSLLEVEGEIFREDRRGWFISPSPLRYDPSKTLSFEGMAKAQNRVPKTKLIEAKSVVANAQASQLLLLEPFANIYQIERMRYLEGRPVVFTTSFIRQALFPKLLEHDLSESLTNIFQAQYDTFYEKVKYRIGTSSLLGDTAQALRATSGSLQC